jgi:very-short-patch-repair endonuclease
MWGVKKIRGWLLDNGYNWEEEKSFDGLIGVGGGSLRFDFWIDELNLCIEFDGYHHRGYIYDDNGFSDFTRITMNDKIKNIYCELVGITLVRIKSSDNNIRATLDNIINNKIENHE